MNIPLRTSPLDYITALVTLWRLPPVTRQHTATSILFTKLRATATGADWLFPLLTMDETLQEDTFEDAHDAAPETPTVRSLTERSLSNPRQSALESETSGNANQESEEEQKEPSPVDPDDLPSENETEDKFEEVETSSLQGDDELTLSQQRRPSVSPTQRISVTSNGQLDNVSLDDETTAEPKGALFEQGFPVWTALTDTA